MVHRSHRRVQLRCRGVVIAVSEASSWLRAGRKTFLLLPLRDIFHNYFQISDTVELDPGIGVWHASDMILAGQRHQAAMWTLTVTTDATEGLFFHARFDCPEISIDE